MMEQLNRQVLSLQECQFIGSKLGFDAPSLKACLDYLRQLHIVSFYDVLPNVIFASCQVVLDKITELVVYSLELKEGERVSTWADRKFTQQGILSLEILQSKACSKHYNKYFHTRRPAGDSQITFHCHRVRTRGVPHALCSGGQQHPFHLPRLLKVASDLPFSSISPRRAQCSGSTAAPYPTYSQRPAGSF